MEERRSDAAGPVIDPGDPGSDPGNGGLDEVPPPTASIDRDPGSDPGNGGNEGPAKA